VLTTGLFEVIGLDSGRVAESWFLPCGALGVVGPVRGLAMKSGWVKDLPLRGGWDFF
jgi:hypothetical protein